jgi:hypothetical protein
MKTKEILLFITLISGTIYNFDNAILRMLWILLWAFLPIMGLMFSHQYKIPKKQSYNIPMVLFIILLLLVTFLKNINSLEFGFSGSQVEKMTPFLFIFHMFTLYYFYQFKKFNINFITYFFIAIVSIIILDMIIRYMQSPNLFLNYHHRQSAKNLGFFNNTNIEGAFIAFLLVVSWQIKFQFQKFLQFLMFIVLITTMARAAIVSVMFIYGLQKFMTSFKGIKKIISIFLLILLIILIIIDPLDFQHDGSLWSKIYFLERSYELIINGNLKDIIFGYSASLQGVIAVLDVDGHSPHVAIVKSFLYYGLIGILIWFYILYYFIKNNKKMKFPIYNYILFSLAGAPIYWPTLSVGLIIIMIYENIERNKINVNKQFK